MKEYAMGCNASFSYDESNMFVIEGRLASLLGVSKGPLFSLSLSIVYDRA